MLYLLIHEFIIVTDKQISNRRFLGNKNDNALQKAIKLRSDSSVISVFFLSLPRFCELESFFLAAFTSF